MRKIMLILSISIILSACNQKPCAGPFPDHVYEAGDVALFKKSGEQVRVISPWMAIGGSRCYRKTSGHYTVRFPDGSEVDVNWHQLDWRIK